jgi:3-dehydroquinate synthase
VAGIKNLIGTFTPPNKIYIAMDFLKTLNRQEIFSGIGEMIKVHGIAGIDRLDEISRDYDQLVNEPNVLKEYINKSLLIKKDIIEIDEFDTGVRNIMNYGHTFGHAVESASYYGIAHGIAVTIGQAMACRYSYDQKLISEKIYKNAHSLLIKNFFNCREVKIQFPVFLSSIKKDKKNIGSQIAVIVPINDSFKIEKKLVNADDTFIKFCRNFFIDTGFKLEE